MNGLVDITGQKQSYSSQSEISTAVAKLSKEYVKKEIRKKSPPSDLGGWTDTYTATVLFCSIVSIITVIVNK